ncbi:hypothetical protein KIW84_022316 [Lathyrus oleraceus]|uniref:Retrotransposon gag domain-containing protein n=1 Tax=Pisum sativum TaxID=3888 RepID=A0A9D4YBD7_PEA|nr:hypothetical protein KIW84_022316 [Pisum sativum]
MADNTRMKELAAEVKRQGEVLEKNEQSNAAHFARMETMQLLSESRFAELSKSMEMMLKQMQALNVTHGSTNSASQTSTISHSSSSGTATPPPPFYVRNIKLEFPRFNDFGPSIYDCPRASLFKLQQIKFVNDYYLEFIALSNRVYGLSNDALIDCFVSGLKEEIRRDVMLHCPISIVKAVSIAKLFEEKLSVQKFVSAPQKSVYTQNRTHFNPTRNDQTQTTEKATNPPLLPTPPTRPMSQFQKNPAIKRILQQKCN